MVADQENTTKQGFKLRNILFDKRRKIDNLWRLSRKVDHLPPLAKVSAVLASCEIPPRPAEIAPCTHEQGHVWKQKYGLYYHQKCVHCSEEIELINQTGVTVDNRRFIIAQGVYYNISLNDRRYAKGQWGAIDVANKYQMVIPFECDSMRSVRDELKCCHDFDWMAVPPMNMENTDLKCKKCEYTVHYNSVSQREKEKDPCYLRKNLSDYDLGIVLCKTCTLCSDEDSVVFIKNTRILVLSLEALIAIQKIKILK